METNKEQCVACLLYYLFLLHRLQTQVVWLHMVTRLQHLPYFKMYTSISSFYPLAETEQNVFYYLIGSDKNEAVTLVLLKGQVSSS